MRRRTEIMELSRSWGRGRRTSVGCDDDEAALATEILSKLECWDEDAIRSLILSHVRGRLQYQWKASEGTEAKVFTVGGHLL